MWVGRVSLPLKIVIVFVDTKNGDGVEAWINLKEEDMAKFGSDKKLIVTRKLFHMNFFIGCCH